MLSHELNQYVLILTSSIRPDGLKETEKYILNVQQALARIPPAQREEQHAEFQQEVDKYLKEHPQEKSVANTLRF